MSKLVRTRIQGVLYQLVQCQLRLINGQQMRTQVVTSIILNGSLTWLLQGVLRGVIIIWQTGKVSTRIFTNWEYIQVNLYNGKSRTVPKHQSFHTRLSKIMWVLIQLFATELIVIYAGSLYCWWWIMMYGSANTGHRQTGMDKTM